ncbi:AMP-binding protein [Bordetella genomosp. 13]|uniref:Carrier domain-containing protein n=1 Tax=Bordetella genomosp. 13 TaxID=463040 RepID=A0A1W6Z9K7_9BORD|nr:AMP-binding protein [Bordetella genomosp. 13]ARP93997.1 hypothetical protein CAL15_06135 [Bordetella genomosp. 13]
MSNLVQCLRQHAARQPDRSALVVLQAGTPVGEYTYAELDARVRALAAYLQGRYAPGDRVLLLMHSGADYVTAFLACLYSGVIAVPAYPPAANRDQRGGRLAAIAADAEASAILTTAALAAQHAEALAVLGSELVEVDAVDPAAAGAWREYRPQDDDIAFLQYTSGSTANPKGVMVSHGNLMANEVAMQEGLGVREDDVYVNWLPLYHDMGLIGGLLQPLYRGIRVVLMPPQDFLERPLRWLQAIAQYGGTISGGPDFAFKLCAERVRPEQAETLDLSSWRLAFSGSEPVRHATLEAFVSALAPARFDPSAVFPCYGLAEGTLFVTGAGRGNGMTVTWSDAQVLAGGRIEPATQASVQATPLVSCGRTATHHAVRIVDPESGSPRGEGEVGEILFSGPSVTHGYWRNPTATASAFVDIEGTRWLRTGDLGALHDGALYVAGRSKDLIIVRGQNLYPQDLEQAVEDEVSSVRKGRVIAFAANVDGAERIGVAAEIGRTTQKTHAPGEIAAAIGRAVAQACGEVVHAIVLLNPGGLPKTSSGKLQRAACRQGWQEGTLDAYAQVTEQEWLAAQAQDHAPPATDLERSLAEVWAEGLGLSRVSVVDPFYALGGTSVSATQIAALAHERHGLDVPLRSFFEGATVREQARLLSAAPLRTQSEQASAIDELLDKLEA